MAASTAFMFKQWGGRTPKAGGRELDGRTWDEYPNGSRKAVSDNPYDVPGADPLELAKLFSIDINAPSPNGTNSSSAPADTNAREAVDLTAYPTVQDALKYPVLRKDGSVNRSDTTYSVVAACGEEGLKLEQMRWAVDQDPKLAARVVEFLARTPPKDDVKECYERWLSLNAWAQPVATPPPGAQQQATPTPPGAQQQATPPPPGAQQQATPPPPGAQQQATPPPPGGQPAKTPFDIAVDKFADRERAVRAALLAVSMPKNARPSSSRPCNR